MTLECLTGENVLTIHAWPRGRHGSAVAPGCR